MKLKGADYSAPFLLLELVGLFFSVSLTQKLEVCLFFKPSRYE